MEGKERREAGWEGGLLITINKNLAILVLELVVVHAILPNLD